MAPRECWESLGAGIVGELHGASLAPDGEARRAPLPPELTLKLALGHWWPLGRTVGWQDVPVVLAAEPLAQECLPPPPPPSPVLPGSCPRLQRQQSHPTHKFAILGVWTSMSGPALASQGSGLLSGCSLEAARKGCPLPSSSHGVSKSQQEVGPPQPVCNLSHITASTWCALEQPAAH